MLLLVACSPQPLQMIGASKYYVEIDGKGEAQVNEKADDTRNEYDLAGFDKDGELKELLFTADHELREGAFLEIYFKKSDVVTYEEVDFSEIPKKVQELLNE